LSRCTYDLLARFVARQDQEAFAELVRRHGGMVLRAARTVLRDGHGAEDVLQATFLVLARKVLMTASPAVLPNAKLSFFFL
jgi:DNA-directed RNA polymerase specialized sigma24 family protein